jgi:phosphatidylglycerol lysyltransferase
MTVDSDAKDRRGMKTMRAFAGPVFTVFMLGAALWLLHHELRDYTLHSILHSLAGIPSHRLWLAFGLTVANYVILIGYDWVGIRYIRHPMSFPRVMLASFLGYAVGNNAGTVMGGSAIRLRLYTAWGLSAVEIVKLVILLSVTFWIGLCALAGVVFVVDPLPIPSRLHLPVASTFPLGIVLSCLAIAYLLLCAFHRTPWKIRQWEFSPPPVGLSLLQYLFATLDLMVAAAVLYVLMPASLQVTYSHFLAVYLLALLAALCSQVPGGLGVLELVLLVLLSPAEPQSVVGALLAYRVIYYLIPLAIGLLVLGGNEIALNRRHVGRMASALGRCTVLVAPPVMALTVMLSGVLLLFSGATPAAEGRLHLLRDLLPLPVIEMSHLMGSIVGMLLVLLARSLQRRIESAYYAVAALLAGGIAFSLLKGFDYEEAILLSVMLLVFLPCRRHYHRKGALLTERFSPGWFAAILLVIGCTQWLTNFAYKHVDYRNELWWQFELCGHAPRSLRAMAGATLVTLLFASLHLLRAKPKAPKPPTGADLETARRIVAGCPRASAHLALTGDKYFLFNPGRTAFIMYGMEGRSWVSMGDPVGDETGFPDLALDFREACDAGGRWPVFYQVDAERMPMYVDMGFTLIKLGEAARVPLAGFGLEGSRRKNLRHAHKQLTAAGCVFEWVEPPLEDGLMAEVARVSEAWLVDKAAAEKGFSLGFFGPDYIRQGPVALVRQQGVLMAFANVWCGAGKEELSVDLMRYRPDSPNGVMEFLFIKLMLWGQEQGYQWFDFGMAPLSGIEAQPLGPLWNRMAALAFRHGEHFYHFQGLRQYKDKFDPVWSPKYLAAPGTLALPVILSNVAMLISGGLVELVKKDD